MSGNDNVGRSLVFVYGSLKRGFHNHRIIGDPHGARLMGTQHITGNYRMADLGAYPGLYKHKSLPVTTIVGEVYAVTQDVLRALDILEGNEFYYTRQRVPSLNGKGPKVWCYFLPYPSTTAAYRDSPVYETAVQCWRATPEEHAYILTNAAELGAGEGAVRATGTE